MADHVETDALLQQARVTLGGVEHTIRVRSIRDTAEFRRVLGHLLGNGLSPLLSVATDGGKLNSADLLASLLPALLGDGLDSAHEIVSLYAPELVEAVSGATDEEVVGAALEVVSLALPLAIRTIRGLLTILARHGVTVGQGK